MPPDGVLSGSGATRIYLRQQPIDNNVRASKYEMLAQDRVFFEIATRLLFGEPMGL